MSTGTELLRQQYIDYMAASLDQRSRFYRQDVADLVHAAERKTHAQLEDSLARWQAIDAVTPEECAAHCQLGGLRI